jgi:hypothetical protein
MCLLYTLDTLYYYKYSRLYVNICTLTFFNNFE